MTEFTCDKCNGTFNKNWSDKEAEKEFSDSPWNLQGDDIAVICDDCFEKFKEWFASLSPEDHEKIRKDANISTH